MKQTIYRSKEYVKAHDIFYAEHYNLFGKKQQHYFYCVYTQENDSNNDLFRDVVGLLITTKKPPGYFVRVTINGTDAYILCDNVTRFIADSDKITNKHIKVTYKTKRNVLRCYKKFINENFKQLKRGMKT